MKLSLSTVNTMLNIYKYHVKYMWATMNTELHLSMLFKILRLIRSNFKHDLTFSLKYVFKSGDSFLIGFKRQLMAISGTKNGQLYNTDFM